MKADAAVAAALAALRAGRADDARHSAEEIWRVSSDPRAAGLLALVEMESGRLDSALEWNDRASAADPGNAGYAVQGARIVGLMGDHAGSFDRFAALLRTAPPDGATRAWRKNCSVSDSAMALMRFFASTAAALGLKMARGAP